MVKAHNFQSTLWTVIRMADRGDEAALREFALKYRPPVVAYLARHGFGQDAEDLAQEVFLRLHRDRVLSKADPEKGRFRSLLLSVTRHVVGHHIEKIKSLKSGGGEVRPLGDLDVAEKVSDDQFDREWVSHMIEVALARLAREFPHYHEALRWFLLEGKPCAEIASSMEKSESEVYNYISRGKRKLVDYLQDEVRDYSTSRTEFEEEVRYLSGFFPKK